MMVEDAKVLESMNVRTFYSNLPIIFSVFFTYFGLIVAPEGRSGGHQNLYDSYSMDHEYPQKI